jgi:hypothetical protein
MQRTINSNWKLLNLIRSRPTMVGQYNQACLELEKLMDTQRETKRMVRMNQLQIDTIELDIRELQDSMAAMPDDSFEYQRRVLRIQMMREEIDRFICANEREGYRLEECEREARVCQQELQRILSESSVDFPSLSQTEYQALMDEESQRFLSRNLAAAEMSRLDGYTPGAAEAMLTYAHVMGTLAPQRDEMLAAFTGNAPALPA